MKVSRVITHRRRLLTYLAGLSTLASTPLVAQSGAPVTSPATPRASPVPHTENTLRLADGAGPGAARIADFTFLVGSWRGRGIEQAEAEEIWAQPAGGQMMGVFRQFKPDGTPRFYEFMLLTEVEASVELRLKHFNPDATGWEEKDKYVRFRLAKVEPAAAWFHGLTFRREDQRLRIDLAMRQAGELKEVRFDLQKGA
jgi:hypothetical protein